MKAISDELLRIATLLGKAYFRASDLNEANSTVHYQDLPDEIIMYVGFGNASIEQTGSSPYQTVETTVYCLKRKTTIDQLATITDDLLLETQQVAADIIYNFDTTPDLLSYTLEPVLVFDDKFVGYLLTFSPAIDAPVCTPTV